MLLTSGEAGRSALPAHLLEGFDGVHAHLSPFGLTGPYSGFRGTELNAAALGGLTAYFGEAGREPLAPPLMVGTYQAALAATIGVLAAVQAEPRTRTLDIAEYEVLATNVISALYSLAFFHGPILRRIGRRRPNPYPYSILPCKDGWVTLVFLPGQQWQRLLAVMGNPEWSSDPRLKSRRAIAEHHFEEVDAHVSEPGWASTRRPSCATWRRRRTSPSARSRPSTSCWPTGSCTPAASCARTRRAAAASSCPASPSISPRCPPRTAPRRRPAAAGRGRPTWRPRRWRASASSTSAGCSAGRWSRRSSATSARTSSGSSRTATATRCAAACR